MKAAIAGIIFLTAFLSYGENDRDLLISSDVFGYLKTSKIEKVEGNVDLTVWKPWEQFAYSLNPNFISSPAKSLQIQYDELWTYIYDDLFTQEEKKKWEGTFDIYQVFWKVGEIQGLAILKYYTSDPVTGKPLDKPGHRIVKLYGREHVMREVISERQKQAAHPRIVEPWKKENNFVGAYIYAKDFVKAKLISPKSAKFPSVTVWKNQVEQLGNQSYKITSYVDSKNAFGVMIRNHFVAVMEETDKNTWRLISLEFQER